MSNLIKKCFLSALCLLALAAAAPAQVVSQLKGSDSMVDYKTLVKIGPWDDRNYQLTSKDLELLADNETELKAQIPAFFRVELRQGIPDMQRTGPVQYPRSALQIFRKMYGGYLVDGKIYQGATVQDGEYKILMDPVRYKGIPEKEYWAEKFLNGEVRVTSPNDAAESAIKINPVDTDRVIAGSNGPGYQQVMHYSSDGGETWNESAALPLGNTCCDPTVDWSADGLIAYTATLGSCGGSGCQIWFYRSSDFGQTWDDLPGDRVTLNTGDGNDKEFIHVDKHLSSPYVDNIYATWHASNVLQFARSTDQGETWSNITFSSASDQRGIGSDITTDKGGDVYYFWPAYNSQRILLRKSTDGGSSFGSVIEVAATEGSFAYPVPSMETREVFIYNSTDTDFSSGPYGDSVYVAWTDSTGSTGNNANNNHSRIQVAYSRDGGSSWTVTTPHETADAGSVDRWHQWLAVGADGLVHVVYYDTRNGDRTTVDLYHSFSVDGAQTWSSPARITAEQSPNIGDSFEYGDYNGLDAVLSDLIAIYTDNRNEGGGGGDSVDVYAAGIPVTGGCTPQANADAGADRTITEGDSTTIGTPAQAGTTYSWSPGGATSAEVSVSPTSTTTYTVTATTVCGSAQSSVTVTVGTVGGDGELVNGVTVTGLDAATGDWLHFYIDVPTGATTLTVAISGGTGEPDLFVRYGAQPDDDNWDCRPWLWSTEETCTFSPVTAGRWYAAIDAYEAISGSTITATHDGAQGCTTSADCDDGAFCNGSETCNAGSCQAGTAVSCDDGVSCTDDVCNEATDSCDSTVNDANCDNGAWCDGVETCSATQGCQGGTAPDCNDGVSCTADSCNEGTDSCDNALSDAACDDGVFCNGSETCDAVSDCQAGSNPCGAFGCDETGDVCLECGVDADCDDGAFCNGSETCDAGSCTAGSDPCPGQTCDEGGDICTVDGAVQLTNGVTVTGLGAPEGDWLHFYIDVPADATTLTVAISGGTGEPDLFVRYGAQPDDDNWDCRPWLWSTEETCTFSPVTAGRWYAAIDAWYAFSGSTITATHDGN